MAVSRFVTETGGRQISWVLNEKIPLPLSDWWNDYLTIGSAGTGKRIEETGQVAARDDDFSTRVNEAWIFDVAASRGVAV